MTPEPTKSITVCDVRYGPGNYVLFSNIIKYFVTNINYLVHTNSLYVITQC